MVKNNIAWLLIWKRGIGVCVILQLYNSIPSLLKVSSLLKDLNRKDIESYTSWLYIEIII